MLSRIETMMLTASSFPIEAIRGQIASAIDIIVHLGRLKDRSRKILEITEVAGFQNGEIMLNPLFVYEIIKDKEGDRLMRTENPLKNTSKLIMQGGAVI